LAKTHHALVDGVSGTDLLAVIMDLSPDTARPEPSEWTPHAEPSNAELVIEAIENMVRSPYEQVRAARAQTRWLRHAAAYAGEVAEGVFALSGLVRPTALSSLNGPLGPHRRYAWATTTVEDIRAVRKEHGGSFNDVVLACITNGFRELLLSRDEDVERVVRTLVPVSVRARDESGRAIGDGTYENKVSAMFAELPVEIEDPAVRLAAITDQMKDLKESRQALAGEALTSMSGFAPPMLLALGMRIATRAAQHNVNTVTTNVPGPQFPLYAADAPRLPLRAAGRADPPRHRHLLLRRRGQLRDHRRLRHDGGHRRAGARDRGRDGAAAQGVTSTSGIVSTSASKYLRNPDTITRSTDLPSTGTWTLRSP
jgi:WS/DGAT/MGAT family acyltransferase